VPVARLFVRSVPGTGNDIKKPGPDELSYDRIPLRAVSEASRMMKTVRAALPSITTPLLVFRSAEDNVIPRDNGPYVVQHVGSTDKDLVTLTDSYHVATMDNDAPRIFEESAAFIERVTA
jgi:carboxylesterase